MDIGFIAVIIGVILVLWAQVSIAIVGFKEGAGYGIGCLLITPLALYYGFRHWQTCKARVIMFLVDLAPSVLC